MALRKNRGVWHIDLGDPDNLLPGSHGGRYRKSTFTKNKTAALEVHNELEAALIRLKLGLTDVLVKPVKPIPLSELKSSYLEYATPRLEASTIALIRHTFRHLLTFYSDSHLSNALDGTKFQHYLLTNVFHRRHSNKSYTLSNTSINMYVHQLSIIWNWAVDGNMASKNPFNVKKLKSDKNLRRPFSKSDLIELLSVIDDPLFRNLVIFALLTGMRRSELTQISVKGDVDIENGCVYVRIRKDDEPLIIPITSFAYSLIEGRLHADRLFPFKNDFVTKKMRKYIDKVDIPSELTFHSLRHTTPTVLFQRDANPRKIQVLMGHSDLKMTEHYTQYSGTDLLEPMAIMEDFIKEILEDVNNPSTS